jgi:Lysophospholipase
MKRLCPVLFICFLCVQSFTAYSQSLADSTFKEEPIQLATPAGTIVGTLAIPATQQNMPLVLIIAGSGPTDRNGNQPGLSGDCLKLLAHALAKKGIASVRFDKRGIGESKPAARSEAELRFDTYVQDATHWMELLKKDKRFNKVYILGHSEGSLIGILSAAHGADGLISIAGPGQPAYKVLKEQLKAQPEAIRNRCYAIIDSLVAGKTVTDVEAHLYALFRPTVQPYMINWFQYDPAEHIARLTIPVLIIQGTNDIQVPVEEANRLAKANAQATLLLIDNMNHVFRIVSGGRSENMAAYGNAALPISEKMIKGIYSFIMTRK